MNKDFRLRFYFIHHSMHLNMWKMRLMHRCRFWDAALIWNKLGPLLVVCSLYRSLWMWTPLNFPQGMGPLHTALCRYCSYSAEWWYLNSMDVDALGSATATALPCSGRLSDKWRRIELWLGESKYSSPIIDRDIIKRGRKIGRCNCSAMSEKNVINGVLSDCGVFCLGDIELSSRLCFHRPLFVCEEDCHSVSVVFAILIKGRSLLILLPIWSMYICSSSSAIYIINYLASWI